MGLCNEVEVLNYSDCFMQTMRDIKNYVEILDLGDGKSDDVIKRKSEKRKQGQF